MPKEIRHKGSFKAVDQDGKDYIINIFVDIIDAGTRGDPNAEIEGLKQLRTSDGLAVNWLKKGMYKIVQTGQTLTSNDPDAP